MPAPRVFVSHSNLDNAFTERLVNDLREGGADVWVDFEQIASGNFARSINEGLGTCDWVVLVQTPNALKSDWVQEEINTAVNLKHKKRITDVIPVIAAPCPPRSVPAIWDSLHSYDATTDYARAVSGVLRAIGIPRADAPGTPTMVRRFAAEEAAPNPPVRPAAHPTAAIVPPPTPNSTPAESRFSRRGNVELILIPEGDFIMGGTEKADEKPQRRVCLDAYVIGKTPVTVAQFKAYYADKGLDFRKLPKPSWGGSMTTRWSR